MTSSKSDLSYPIEIVNRKPCRILHVLGGMDRGGVETWLMHVLRHIDRQNFHMDFAVHTDQRCSYDAELESLGSKIHFCPTPSNPLRYSRNFLRILREHGPYDVVHSHVHHFSGFVLKLAQIGGVQKRIAHSHNDTTYVDSGSSIPRRLYLKTGQQWIYKHATVKLAASGMAANSLLRPDWRLDLGTKVLYYGIDFEPFKKPVDKTLLKAEFGFEPDSFVIGHVGRLVPQKNHEFLLKIYAEILQLEPKAYLLLAGKGPLEKEIKLLTEQLGLTTRVRFAGVRSDIPELMLGAMDAFVLPSLYEGLGLVAVEAQAAGLPTILSDKVPAEADTECGLARFVPLEKSASEWAQVIVEHSKGVCAKQSEILSHVSRSRFSIQNSTDSLCKFYSQSV